jgi:hypothetical protein
LLAFPPPSHHFTCHSDYGYYVATHPDGGTLYLVFSPILPGTGHLFSVHVTSTGLQPDDLAVFAHSTVTNPFNNWRLVRITIQ